MIKDSIAIVTPKQLTTTADAPTNGGYQKGVFGALMNAISGAYQVRTASVNSTENEQEIQSEASELSAAKHGNGEMMEGENSMEEILKSPLKEDKIRETKFLKEDINQTNDASAFGADGTIQNPIIEPNQELQRVQSATRPEHEVAVEFQLKEETSSILNVEETTELPKLSTASVQIIQQGRAVLNQETSIVSKPTVQPVITDIEQSDPAASLIPQREDSSRKTIVRAQNMTAQGSLKKAAQESVQETGSAEVKKQNIENLPDQANTEQAKFSTIKANTEFLVPPNKTETQAQRSEPEYVKRESAVINQGRTDFLSSVLVNNTTSTNSRNPYREPAPVRLIQPMTDSAVEMESRYSRQAEQENDAKVLNGLDFEKKPELMQLIQNTKVDMLKNKAGKEQRFVLSTSEQADTRMQLVSNIVRAEETATREAQNQFTVLTSADQESFDFNPSLTILDEQEQMLNDLMVESLEVKASKSFDQQLQGYIRLGEMPVTNMNLRRSINMGLTNILQKEVNGEKATENTTWQKHSFKLEDGNSLNLNTRNVDGVLHIKLIASNPELARLIQYNEMDIREHLESELKVSVELQFNGGEEDTAANFFEQSESGKQNGRNHLTSAGPVKAEAQVTNQSMKPSIRNFGYNQMEWIV